MTELLLDLGESYDPARSQWRLERVEMVNWGTFHGGPHRIDLARQGYLLTGPSGSGKSSLVDAISAVLMPRKKVAFNAAATDAAGRSDRSLLSYVRGAWRHGEDAESGEVATDYLRPGATWSGIALRYATADAAAPVTLVKLFAIDRGKNTNADVKELCLILRQPVELMQFAPHLEAGLAVRAIKAAWPDAQATDRHSLFAERFCRIMGVPADTMALLHKAQSAKSLESLDALFRGFMLPRPKTFEIADQAAAQFRELSDAHARVVQARRQVEQLEPLPALVSANKQATEQVRRVERLVESVEPYRDKRKRALAEEELAALTVKLELAESAEAQARRAADEAQEQYLAARAAYERQGGQALLRLENAVERARERLAVVGRSRDELSRDLARVGIDLPGSAEELAELKAAGRGDDQAGAADQLQRHSEAAVAARDAILAELKETRAELEAVAQSRSNLPVAQLQARELLARVSGVPLAQLPFAGELMEVPEQHSDWRGAFERVLRPLAMSLLVPAKHGQAITAAADAHNLRTRLVFRIVPADAPRVERPVMPDSLALRVAVKDGPLAGWLSATLTRRYDYACVGDPAELAPVERGVTRAGQVKHGRDHHEKDDRAEVGDRRRWIMGFDNEARLDRLQAAIRDLRGRAATAEQAVLKAIAERDQAVRRADALDRLAGRAWEDIDVEGATRLEQSATDELESYRVADPDLRRAEHRQDTAKKAAALAEASCQREHDQCVKMRDGIERIRSLLDELVPAGAGDGAGGGAGGGAAAGAAPPPAGLSPADESALAERFNRARSSRRLTHEVIDAVATTVMRGLDGELKAAREQAEAAVGGILQITDQFAREWPADASGLVPGLVDAAGFCAILDRLVADRLPEFEKRFSDLLHTQAQQNIAQLSSTIRRAHREIREAVGSVNRSLTRSHFDVGRYLRINVKLDRPRAAEDFLADLKDIASGSWSDQSADDPAAAEAKYNVMAGIMTRLGSGEPADLRWRELCLDTRRHVRFSGEELDESGAVTAVHESGSGLSGGQQQKLAIFCLAAALRFQLAPEDGAVPNYGTVILDEAFDRADVDFTRMAMDIFVAFGFHMVLATPLKLIQTLEPYIGGIGVVSCRDRRQSTVAPVTMENALAAEVGAGAPAADAAVAG